MHPNRVAKSRDGINKNVYLRSWHLFTKSWDLLNRASLNRDLGVLCISSLIFISLLLCSRRWNVDREFYFWERCLSLIRHKVLEKTILEWCLGKAWSMRKGQFVFHFFWHPNTSSSNICFHYVVHVIQCTQNTLHSTSIGTR